MALLLFAITMATVSSSCSKEYSYKRKIEGYWQVKHFYGQYEDALNPNYGRRWDNWYANGELWSIFDFGFDHYDIETSGYPYDTDDELKFLERRIMGMGDYNVWDGYEGACNISGDTFVLEDDGYAESAEILELTNTTLILHFDCNYVTLGPCKYEATIELKKYEQ